MISYDKIPENASGLLMDLPFYEAGGAVTRDVAKPHHQDVDLINTPTWETLASGLSVLTFDGISDEYLKLAAADCVDLNFMGGDYSFGCWINWTDDTSSQIIMGRYELNVCGWEIYLFGAGGINYLTLRHSHAAGATTRSACYSVHWTPGEWLFLGISRTGGGEALHYRNGAAVDMVTGGLLDPETSPNDLCNCRFSQDWDWYNGKLWRPRFWNRALSASEWSTLFGYERDYFGV